MLALGTRGGLPEPAIARHIINGINEPNLKKKISNEYDSCNKLLKDIINYCNYNDLVSVNSTVQRHEKLTPQNKEKSANTRNGEKNNENFLSKIKCYNCSKMGHYSANCPDPSRKPRCKICQRTTHPTEKCPEKLTSKTNVNQINLKSVENDIIKVITVNGYQTNAFVDPGSNRSLIRKSYASIIGDIGKTKIILEGFGGGEYECTGKVHTVLVIDDNSFEVDLLVVNDVLLTENILLGRDALCGEGKRLIIEGEACRLEPVNFIEASEDKLIPCHRNKLEELLCKHRSCFAEDTSHLGRCNVAKMEINVTSDKPVQMKPYRVPFAKRSILTNITNDLLKHEIIRPSDSTYASPVVLVNKSNGEHRMCVDYRQLNAITSKTPYPMPVMDEQFAQLAGNCFFSTLDLRMGYHQIEVEEKSKKYTAFVTHDGHFEYNRMPFGLVNAPAVFQCVMNKLVSKMKPGEILAYLDDIVIPSRSVEEGLERLDRFFEILTESGLTLRFNKCVFLAKRISHLGHIIDENGIRPGDEKISAIKNFSRPTNITEVRRFLGLTGFFRKFVQDYSIISKPITMMLRKNDNFIWGSDQQKSFESLKDVLTKQPVLTLYNSEAQHEVHTDASSLGLAGILLQSEDGRQWKPVFYYSRHCTDAETRYHSYELEALAVVEALERFRIYLLGKSFRLVTDCSAVAKVKTNKELKPRIARWWMRLQEFDFTLIHREGNRMSHVDALSRAPDKPPTEMEPAGFIMKVTAEVEDWVVTMQLKDEKIVNLMAVLKGDLRSDQEKHIRSEFLIKNHRLYRKGENGLKLVIPKHIRWRIVKYSHDDMGHFGLEKTIQRIQQKFWFPKIRKYTKEYIASCIKCCYNKNRFGKSEARLHYSEVQPIPFYTVHVDHLGPFTKSKRGHVYVLAVSDSFSKYLVVRAVRNTKTTPVLNTLNEMTTYFGLPRCIVTDRGTAFTSKQFEDFCNENSIRHIKTAVRTPRANGQVERANQTILSYIRTTVEDPKDWDLTLRKLQWAVNSQKNSTSGFTPNELVFDFELRDITNNHLIAAIQDDVVENPLPIVEKRNLAVENIEKERKKWEKRFNSRHATPHQYIENDIVVIENEPTSTGESRKLEPKFRGPYIVSKVLGNDRYLIEDIPGIQITNRKFSSVYSADKIKPWCSSCPALDESFDEIEDDLMSE